MLHGTKFDMGGMGRPHLRHLEDDALPGLHRPGSMADPELADAAPPRPAAAPAPDGARPAANTLAELPPAPIQQRLKLIRAPLPASARQAPPAPPTLVATAAATVAAAAVAAPSASAQEIAALELVLADPLNREILAAYGKTSPELGDSAVAQDLVARYGAGLAGRLQQLSQAQAGMRQAYLDAMNHAAHHTGPGTPGSVLVPGWQGEHDAGWEPDRWRFDPVAFTEHYAKGDSLAQRAFAMLHAEGVAGPLLQTETIHGESSDSTAYRLASGMQVGGFLGLADSAPEFTHWSRQRLTSTTLKQIDPARPPDLYDTGAVWFDPALGFVTAPANVVQKQDFLDKAVPAVMVIAATAATGGALGLTAAGATSSLGAAIGTGAAMGAIGSVWGGLVYNGKVDFDDVLRGALSGAVTAGVTRAAGLDTMGLETDDAGRLTGQVASYGQRALALTGQATLQGALQALAGGRFRDGFSTGLASGLAAEVSRSLHLEINARLAAKEISAAEASAMRTMARAAGSAVAMLGRPDDLAYGFAQQFLGGLVQDGVGEAITIANQSAFDSDGRLRPGIVDAQAPVLQQAAQLAAHLQGQGMGADEATALALRTLGAAPATATGAPGDAGGPGGVATRIEIVGEALPQDALGNRYETDSQGRQLVALASGGLLALNAAQTVPIVDGVAVLGAGALQRLAQMATGAIGALANPAAAAGAALLLPGNAQRQVVELSDGVRFETRTGELYGTLHERGSDGRWQAAEGRYAGASSGAGFVVIAEDELARLQAPITTPLPPSQPPGPPPLPAWAERHEIVPPYRGEAAAGPGGTVSPGEPVQDWRDLVIDQSARELGEALIAAGIEPPGPGYVPHHIVPVRDGGPDMAAARQRLVELGLSIDDAANGVWLPSHRAEPDASGAYHNRLHNKEYFRAVEVALDGAQTRAEVAAILTDIGVQLRDGTFLGTRPRIDDRGDRP